jgi:spore maturation protein CgeB
MRAALAEGESADVVVKASGVGVFDTELLAGVTAHRGTALRVFWDVDAPATLAEMCRDASHPVRRALAALDLVLTYGGGEPVIDHYREFGAAACVPIYNALDPDTHFPALPDPALAGDLGFLANRMPDRDARAEEFFFRPAAALPQRQFVLGGAGWEDRPMSENVRPLGHVGTERHNVFNASSLAVLNVARDSMASMGFCPATRVFEAAGAGACLITDAWEGIGMFLAPEREVLVARDGQDVAAHLAALTPAAARRIGARARARIMREHTYARRAAQVDRLFRQALARKRQMRAA